MLRASKISPGGGFLGLLAVGIVYLVFGLSGLEEFPPYFFCDEAASANWASHLLRNHFRGERGEFLPTFFPNGGRYNLGTTVYLALPLVALGGKSVVAVRSVTVILTLLGAAALAFALRKALDVALWWAFPLWLAINPAWFLHMRTGFEAPVAVAFYVLALAAGLGALAGEEKAVLAAFLFGALSFYAYAPARLVVPSLLVVLLVLAWPKLSRRTRCRLPGLLGVLIAPYLRFVLAHPQEQVGQLRLLGSGWVGSKPLWERLGNAVSNYLSVWSPRFWLSPEAHHPRHVIPGCGLLHPVVLGLALVGLVAVTYGAARGERAVHHRFLLAGLATAPGAAVLVSPGVTRQLFVVPLLVVFALLGLAAIAQAAGSLLRTAVYAAAIVGSGGVLVSLWANAIFVAPFSATHYGYYGVPWGSQAIYGEVRCILAERPSAKVVVSPNCANGVEELAKFFGVDMARIQVVSPDWYSFWYRELPAMSFFVLPPDEFSAVRNNRRFTSPRLRTVLFYPSGTPAFYVCSFGYSPQARAIIGEEAAARRQPVHSRVQVLGEPVEVGHSRLDMGAIEDAFDGDASTLIRTMEANPLRLELRFSTTHVVHGLTAIVGACPTGVRVWVATASGWQRVGGGEFPGAQDTRAVKVSLRPVPTSSFLVEVENLGEGEPANVHLWELALEENAGERPQ